MRGCVSCKIIHTDAICDGDDAGHQLEEEQLMLVQSIWNHSSILHATVTSANTCEEMLITLQA